jgi:hypothetical protein
MLKLSGLYSLRIITPTLSGTHNRCLSPFDLLYQNTQDWVTCRQQKFIAHSSGSWEVQGWGPGRCDVCWGLILCFANSASHGGRACKLPESRFIGAQIPTMRSPPSQRLHLLVQAHRGLGSNVGIWRRHKHPAAAMGEGDTVYKAPGV